jgi:hypothetical protein
MWTIASFVFPAQRPAERRQQHGEHDDERQHRRRDRLEALELRGERVGR